MQLDRRGVIAGLAVTVVAPTLPALAALPHRAFLDGLIASGRLDDPLAGIPEAYIAFATWRTEWQFHAPHGDDWAIRHVFSGFTLVREPQPFDPDAMRVIRRDAPRPVAMPDAVPLLPCAVVSLASSSPSVLFSYAVRAMAQFAAREFCGRQDLATGIFFRYVGSGSVAIPAPPIWASAREGSEAWFYELAPEPIPDIPDHPHCRPNAPG